uniref:Ribosomal protein S2 n=1 Tax=Trachydiscus minutus TaxID=1032745 RepID=A0A140F2N8_9STRA|nr:ribosomal protein S2 [Trachydiscus minutus]AML60672.1 ribosomal protein S2 [Trachydiscus minutus]
MKEKKKVNKFLLNKLMYYGLHIGGLKRFFNPKAKVYLIGVRNDFGILDLSLTHYNIRRIMKLLYKVVISNKKILFIGTPVGLENSFALLCKKCGHYYLDSFTDGFFTNFGNSDVSVFGRERPALVFFFDTLKYQKVKKEVLRLNIPVVSFINTNDTLSGIDYPIPANIRSWKGGVFVYNVLSYVLLFTSRVTFIKK